MDRPFKWTRIYKILLGLLITINQVLSDDNRTGAVPSPVQTVCCNETPQTNANNASPTPQLLNTLLTIAAANGVLPELLPKIQPLGITSPETLAKAQEVPRTVTGPIMQQPTHQQESVPNTQATVSASNPNNVIPSITSHKPATSIVPVQPLVISPGLKQTNQQSNPFIPQISELVQTKPCTYTLTQPKEETKTTTLQQQSKANVPDGIAGTSNPVPVSNNSFLTTESGQTFPVNLQIIVPQPNVEAPNIIFINTPSPTPPVESPTSTVDQYPYSNWYPYGYAAPPQPQEIIVRKKKSWLKDLLPLLLFSMINNDKHCKNECCCCPRNSRRSNTPVPYPIPIPTNNPIINTGYSNLSRKRGNKRYDDEDDEL